MIEVTGHAVQTWDYRYLFKTMISFPSDIHPEVALADHVVVLFLIF